MKKMKRIAATALAFLTVCAVPSLGACDKGGDKTSSSSESSSGEPLLGECADKGHGYDYKTGLCVRCGKKAVIPPLPAKQKFPLVEPCTHDIKNCPDCDYSGTGENKWNRLELFVDCYTVEIGKTGELWLSFSPKEPNKNGETTSLRAGQYALHSVDGDNGVTVTRHAANAEYVNDEGIPAVKENGNFYAYDNCGEGYLNSEWRSTYRIKGAQGTQVKIRFVRIDEPAWEPETIHTKIYPTELKTKAENVSKDMELKDVPYESEYFFDESMGCYRMGTQASPGAVIYAAIDTPALRLFGKAEEGEDAKFTTLLKNSGTALNIGDGVTANGDYNVLCYTPFIMNWKDENASWGSRPGETAEEPEADLNKVCYQNYCNDDGVYPVNKELFKFLNLYVKANKPADDAISAEDWAAKKDYLWLSACYYYKQSKQGTLNNPYVLIEGNNTVSIKIVPEYFQIGGSGSFTLHCDTPDVMIKIDGAAAIPLDGATVQATDVFNVMLNTAVLQTVTVTVNVTKN